MPDKNYSPSMSNLLTVDDDDIVFFLFIIANFEHTKPLMVETTFNLLLIEILNRQLV